MAINRAQLVKELVPGLHALFGLEYERYPAEYEEIFDTESSETLDICQSKKSLFLFKIALLCHVLFLKLTV